MAADADELIPLFGELPFDEFGHPMHHYDEDGNAKLQEECQGQIDEVSDSDEIKPLGYLATGDPVYAYDATGKPILNPDLA